MSSEPVSVSHPNRYISGMKSGTCGFGGGGSSLSPNSFLISLLLRRSSENGSPANSPKSSSCSIIPVLISANGILGQ
jgi:hypothetical protein